MSSLFIPKKGTNHHRPPHNINPGVFFSEHKDWSSCQGTVHPSIVVSQVNPTKILRPAVFTGFGWGPFAKMGLNDLKTDHWPLGNIQNLNEVETKIAKPKMCQKCSVLFSKTAKMHVNCDRYGVMAPFQSKVLASFERPV